MCSSHKQVVVDGKQRYLCHRATLPVAKRGTLKEPLENYGRWAYFCGAIRGAGSGWTSKPCNCTEHTTLKK